MPSIISENATTSSVPPSPSSPVSQGSISPPVCHGLFYDAFLVVQSALFVLFLAFHAKKNLRKLCNGRSYMIISYYAILWLVSLLNLAWCLFQAMQCSPNQEIAWNLLSLFTTSGLLYLEISLVAFILQGNYINGLEGLSRTFLVTGVIVGADILLKAIYVFGFGVPLFIDVGTANRAKFLQGDSISYRKPIDNRINVEEDFLLDNAYYSEMKDAGFFDADWD
ncbi:hypothetical protein SAY87_026319 [Trapa incisa]|uniref:Uncharacterized protein n=1 Tax=Trapa incisa TaxID=236973 RepID=A0AAN7H2A5_9MYRT|nr:hypothetical protein SAY87_026319 [Trapa incisa]